MASRLDRPGPLFLCMEGCLKADSVLTVDQDAISVPSVTCWQGVDLEIAVSRMLERQRRAAVPTLVVSDSDWFVNDQVARQAQLLAEYLKSVGVWAVPIAPPALPGEDKTGVDDFLYRGGDLLNLDDITPRPKLSNDDIRELVALGARAKRTRSRVDAVERATRVLVWMQRYCTGIGSVSGYDMEIADQTGLTRGETQGAIRKLLELEFIRQDRASDFVPGRGWAPRRWLLLDKRLVPDRTGTARDVMRRAS